MKPATRLPLLLLLTVVVASAGDWTRFRGPNGTGIAADSGYPLEFGPDKNVVWKTEVRKGKSSPILSDDRLFLTSFGGEKLYTQCFDRETGKLLWEKSVGRKRSALLHEFNEPGSVSPVTDGKNVYVFFEDVGMLSYTSEGKLRWKTPLGPFFNEQGLGASPILVGGLLILQADHAAGSYIAAFNPENGETVWKTDRPETDSWTTPLVHQDRIVTVSTKLFGSYDPKTGKRILMKEGAAGVMVASAVLAGDTVFAFGYNFLVPPSFDGPLKKLDQDGDGAVSPAEYGDHSFYTAVANYRGDRDGILEKQDSDEIMGKRDGPDRLVAMRLESGGNAKELWHYEQGFNGVIPTPIAYDGILYFVKNGGILTALDAETGKMLKRGRLGNAIEGYSASPVAADGRLFFLAEDGKLSVVRPGADWEVERVNDLGEGLFATPALSDGAIYLRTDSALYRFEE